MKIYTKTGDAGQTGLLGGARVPKDHLRVTSYGEVDELNAVLGLARAHGMPAELSARLERVQGELFSLGAELATAPGTNTAKVPAVQQTWIDAFEREIDSAEAELPKLVNFVLPGGAPAAAWLHVARTTARRAERAIVGLSHQETVDPLILVYVNRLSDWLFTMARLANQRAGVTEPIWKAPSR